jgi:hypothetical protein
VDESSIIVAVSTNRDLQGRLTFSLRRDLGSDRIDAEMLQADGAKNISNGAVPGEAANGQHLDDWKLLGRTFESCRFPCRGAGLCAGIGRPQGPFVAICIALFWLGN